MVKIPLGSVRVSTIKYWYSHSKKPRGKGHWWFEIAGKERSFVGSYGEASLRARRIAASMGVREIRVLP